MSMIKQLWIAIAVMALLALGGSLVVSTLSARHYLEQQLHIKNVDNAASLALSMSQMPKDPVTIELLLSAQFDAGHYEYIRLIDPQGEPLVVREDTGAHDGVPKWFVALVPIDADEGIAQVQDGWKQFGTLALRSHSRFVYQSLWESTLDLLLWFMAGGLACAVLGTFVLRRVVGPLSDVVDQAKAIGERRFLTVSEPRTAELREVVGAMNALSGRVRSMLEDESARLEAVRREAQNDPLTGLLNREYFLSRVEAALSDDDTAGSGTLAILRVPELGALNAKLGRVAADAILQRLASVVETIRGDHDTRAAGRLNGTDFALLVADDLDTEMLTNQLRAAVDLALGKLAEELDASVPIGLAAYRRSDTLAQVLAHADMALEHSREAGDGRPMVENVDSAMHPATSLAAWRKQLGAAIKAGRLTLKAFPVLRASGELLHREGPVRLRLEDDSAWLTAGEFMPWASRAGLLSRIDEAVLRMAIDLLDRGDGDVCINLATESMCDKATVASFRRLLADRPDVAGRLWIDLPEVAAFRHPQAFRELCATLKPLGLRIGLEHVGQFVCRIGELHDVGLDYLKIGGVVIHGIDDNPGIQTFLRGLATIAHTMGVLVIAEGVASEAQARQLERIGFDGLTGPGVREL